MKTKHFLLFLMLVAVAVACKDAPVVGNNGRDVPIWPDYKGVTIPPNIAPMDFGVVDSTGTEYGLLITANHIDKFIKASGDGNFTIPERLWREALANNRGGSIRFTVCERTAGGQWTGTKPFDMHVANDSIDPYIAYRLIPPGYGLWNKMGIYQRCLENYRQTPIMENKLTDQNCMNCHSFPLQDPSRMVFHMRARNGGTVHIDGKRMEKLNTKTPQTISALVYPYWHPSGRFIAFSNNETAQAFFLNHINRIEVYDSRSDVVVYDVDRHEIISTPLLKDSTRYETFPTFSPDGQWLYFCSSAAVDSMPQQYRQTHYNLCRIRFDARTRTFGKRVETVVDAARDSMSVSFPRISPDGRWLVFTRHHYGQFSIWHKDADLWMLNLNTGKAATMAAVNSRDVESYHSWSHNSRWLVFSSRRGDGLYTRPYFTYIDRQGRAHKPFLLPQRNPRKFYGDLMRSYNIPEMIRGRVKVNRHALGKMMREDPGIDLKFAAR